MSRQPEYPGNNALDREDDIFPFPEARLASAEGLGSDSDGEIPEITDLSLQDGNPRTSHHHSHLNDEAATNIPRYEYRVLKPREIRLLRMLPGEKDEDEIQGNIITVDLDNCPPFVAISYVWSYDDSQIKRFIERWNVNVVKAEDPHLRTPKGSIPISPSLRAALNSARSVRRKVAKDKQKPYKHPLYWADALCINQTDNKEKGHQVVLLTAIYSKADSVHIHLGTVALNSALAIEKFQELCDSPKADDERVAWLYDHKSPAAIAVRDFLDRPWFTRIWIVQEVLTSRNALMVCGNDSISWDDLAKALVYLIGEIFLEIGEGADVQGSRPSAMKDRLSNFIMLGDIMGKSFSSKFQSAQYLATTYHAHRSISAHFGHIHPSEVKPGTNDKGAITFSLFSLFDMLSTYATWKATFQVDHLFALLALCEEQFDPRLWPDYEASLGTILTRYGEFFVDEGKALDMLYNAGISRGSEKCGPSWVPNWTGVESTEDVDIVRSSLGESMAAKTGLYYAGSGQRFEARSFSKSGELRLKGCCIDVIKTVGHGDEGPPRKKDDLFARDLLQQSLPLRDLPGEYPTGESRESVVWRTLVGNSYVDGWEVSDEFGSEFETICRKIHHLENGLNLGLVDHADDYFGTFQLCNLLKGYML